MADVTDETRKEMKAENRTTYGHLYRSRKARWMGSGVVPPAMRVITKARKEKK